MNTLALKKPARRQAKVRTIRIALFGFGVVGTGVWNILQSKRQELRSRFGIDLEIAGICVRDLSKERQVLIETERLPGLITSDPYALLGDDSIEVVLELIGGRYEALDVIEASLESRKHVITANKLLLSQELPRLRTRADRMGVNLFYSASVCGSVPVLNALDGLKIGDEIIGIRGIVNGSTNFILTLMQETGSSYQDALVAAREAGFLEADPTLDVSGADAAQKLSVLIYHAFGEHIRPELIATAGIEEITSEKMNRASESGYAIKLLAHAYRDSSTGKTNGKVCASVSPQFVAKTHLFANTRNEFNALEIECSHAGPQVLYGKGAGSLPTASAVISDLITLLKEE